MDDVFDELELEVFRVGQAMSRWLNASMTALSRPDLAVEEILVLLAISSFPRLGSIRDISFALGFENDRPVRYAVEKLRKSKLLDCEVENDLRWTEVGENLCLAYMRLRDDLKRDGTYLPIQDGKLFIKMATLYMTAARSAATL